MPDISTYNGIDMADIASINGQDAPSGGGGSASTTPTISVAEGLFGVTTITVSNHSSYTNPNYQVTAAVGGTTTITDAVVDHTLDSGSDSVSDTMVFTDSNAAAGTRTVTVKAQEFGDTIQSSAVTGTYDVGGFAGRYVRIRGVTSDGSQTSARLAPYELRFYEANGQAGTSHPTNMASATADTSGNEYYTISAGHTYSSTYPEWKAFDSSGSIYSMWWALGSNAANNWIMIEFDSTQFSTPPTILSMRMGSNNQNDAAYFAIETSSDGSSFTQVGILPITSEQTILNYG